MEQYIMANPTASATLNKAIFAVGEQMILTINHTDADRQTISIAGVVTDSSGNTANWSASAKIDAGTVTFTSTGGKTWTLQTATDNQSVYAATA